jgi:hypothetical protein
VTNSARALALGQHAGCLLAEARSTGGTPSRPGGQVGHWALAAWRALAGDPGRGSEGGRRL